jgi:uncharacterized protein (DUF1499 family)
MPSNLIQDLIRGMTENHACLNLDDVPGTPIQVAAKLNSEIDSRSRWKTVSQAGSGDNIVLHATHATAVFRFIDDIRIELTPGGNDTTHLFASSRSRIGKGDLGQNARNLRQMAGWFDLP